MKRKEIANMQLMISREVNRQLAQSTTWVIAGMILAMEKAHAKVNHDKWFQAFAEIYPKLLEDPVTYVKKAEEIADMEIDIGFLGGYDN